MRALLINPWVYDFKAHDFWVRPYGLLRIASLLKKNGFEIDLLDCMDRFDKDIPEGFRKEKEYGQGSFFCEAIEEKPEPYKKVPRKYKRYGMPLSAFKNRLSSLVRPDIILVTTNVTYMYEGTFLAISLAKEKFPQVPVIAGGIYATICYGHAKERSGADTVWKGSINNEFIRMINHAAGSKMTDLKDGEFRALTPDYSFYPYTPYAAVKFTEGCPFACSYCAIKMFGEGFHSRQKGEILKELDIYRQRGIRNITFYDDALLYKTAFIKDILKEIIDRKYDFNFNTPNGLHAVYIDAETAQLMFMAGFKDVRVPLESSDLTIQKATGGKVTSTIFERAINNLKAAGYGNDDIGVYIITGLPGQGYDSVMRDVEYLKKLGPAIKMSNFSPIPGTLDFERLKPELQAELLEEPLKQNEYYYLMINPEYGWEMNEKVRKEIHEFE